MGEVKFSKLNDSYQVDYPYHLRKPEGDISKRVNREFLPFLRDFTDDIGYFPPDETFIAHFEPGYNQLEMQILLNTIALHDKIVKRSEFLPEALRTPLVPMAYPK